MSGKPGFMVYHDDFLEAIAEGDFSDAEYGQLFKAMVLFSACGAIPEFEDRALRQLWRTIRPKIVRDSDAYETERRQRRYAVYCREQKKLGEQPLPFDAWAHADDDRETTPDDREASPDDRETTPDDREASLDDREASPDVRESVFDDLPVSNSNSNSKSKSNSNRNLNSNRNRNINRNGSEKQDPSPAAPALARFVPP